MWLGVLFCFCKRFDDLQGGGIGLCKCGGKVVEPVLPEGENEDPALLDGEEGSPVFQEGEKGEGEHQFSLQPAKNHHDDEDSNATSQTLGSESGSDTESESDSD